MTCDYIKQEIPEAISEEGGARVQMVNKNTIPLTTSVREAKDGLYVLGDEQLIRGEFQGLFKSMAAGVGRDGHSRQLGDFVTVYAQPEGPVDLEKGWDPSVNSFRLKARLLNEMVLDITDWVFRDLTPGRRPFKLNSVSTGEMSGIVESSKSVHINGSDLPSIATATVEWAIEGTTQSGTIAAAKLTGDCDRIDIAADAMSSIITQANDGKTIVFTVRGNYANAKVSGVLKYVAPVVPTITKVTQTTDGAPDGKISYLDERARLYIQNMPGVENPENEISVTWTKADSSTIVKGRSQIDFLDVSNGYIKPEVPEDLAIGDRFTVKATYNGVDTNVKTVTVV